jgi:hypothetical protein
MPIDYDRKLVFVHVPRTGGTSVEELFGLNRPRNLHSSTPFEELSYKTPQHLTYRELAALLPEPFLRGAYAFSFVRNPWDRFLSEYLWRQSWWFNERRRAWYYGAVHLENLDAFVRTLDLPEAHRLYGPRGFDGHLETQMSYVTNDAGAIAVDFVGRFERFADDVRLVAAHFGMDGADVPHANRGKTRTERDYRGYYTKYSRDAVASFYADDIAAFGYSF